MFKSDWEKTGVTRQLPEDMIEKMTQLTYPNKKLISHKLIVGGCANLNIKIQFENVQNSMVLRIYLRDKDAAIREQKLGILLKQYIPVPQTYSISEVDGYRFAITEFIPGITLRELLLGNIPYDVDSLMYEVGNMLSKITSHPFSAAGFFDENLNASFSNEYDALTFAKNCLQSSNALSVLEYDTIQKIKDCLNKCGHLFPDNNERHLVHGDFDPANILVYKVNGTWKVSEVLDWEFAFSGSILWDVANMLRYAHKMSSRFQDAFINGLITGGAVLSTNWRHAVNLLNLLSLLDCLKRSDTNNRPNQCNDIRELINHILLELNSMK